MECRLWYTTWWHHFLVWTRCWKWKHWHGRCWVRMCCIVQLSYISSIIVAKLINLPIHSLCIFSFPCPFCHLFLFVLILMEFFVSSDFLFFPAPVIISLFRLQEVNSMINKRLKDALFTDQWSELCMDTLSRFGYVLVSMKWHAYQA